MPKITMIYGGPGTGKTHALLEELAKRLERIPAKEIAYVSYTRQGTYQGVDLAKDQYDLTEAECEYFKTLHSLAFHSLELKSDALINSKDLNPMLEKLALKYQQFELINTKICIAENKLSEEQEIAEHVQGVSVGKQKLTREVYTEYKKLIRKLDYTDLLLLVKERQTTLPVKVAFIDEAQDLTTLQWQVVWQFFKNVDELIIAGDPNQSIFEWAGADVNYFLKMRTDEQRVLEKSHRCSRAVWNMAKQVYACIKEKAPIPKEGTEEQGFAIVSNTTELPIPFLQGMANKGSLFCLAQQNAYLDRYIEACVTYGIPYLVKKSGKTIYSVKQEVLSYFKFLCEVRDDPKKQELYITNNKRRPRGEVRKIRTMKEHLEKDNLVRLPWNDTEALTERLYELAYEKCEEPEQAEMLIRAIATGNIKNPALFVTITNVHQVKGGEADYVLFCDNIPNQYIAEAESKPSFKDYLLRIMYVAVTRAKKGICVWHRDIYRTVAPTYLFNNVGSFEGVQPIVSPKAERFIEIHRTNIKEGNNANN